MLQRAAKKSLAENGVYKHYLKLVEAEGTDAVNTIVSVSELIRSEADDGDGSYKVSMDNFLSMLQNAGLNIDYAGLKSYHEADPRLQMEIQDFNEKEVVLAGGGSSEEDTLNMQPQGEVPPEKKVNNMAKSALAKRESIEEMDNLDSQTKYSEGDLVTINGISYVLEKSEDGDLWAISNNAEHEIEFEPGMEDYHQAVGEGYSEMMKTNEAGFNNDGSYNTSDDEANKFDEYEAGEEENNPVVNAISGRIMRQRVDLLRDHGLDKVMQAIDEVAEFVGDVEEIGSSDVSGWIKHVEQMLTNMEESVKEGYYEMPPMDPKYVERKGLEGPFGTRSGKVVYYDPKEGSYYDPDTDIYLSYKEFQAYDDSRPEDYTMDIKMPKKEAVEETFDYWQGVESIAKLAGLRKPK